MRPTTATHHAPQCRTGRGPTAVKRRRAAPRPRRTPVQRTRAVQAYPYRLSLSHRSAAWSSTAPPSARRPGGRGTPQRDGARGEGRVQVCCTTAWRTGAHSHAQGRAAERIRSTGRRRCSPQHPPPQRSAGAQRNLSTTARPATAASTARQHSPPHGARAQRPHHSPLASATFNSIIKWQNAWNGRAGAAMQQGEGGGGSMAQRWACSAATAPTAGQTRGARPLEGSAAQHVPSATQQRSTAWRSSTQHNALQCSTVHAAAQSTPEPDAARHRTSPTAYMP